MNKKEFQKVVLPSCGMELSISEITALEIFNKLVKMVVYKDGNLISDDDLKKINPSDSGYLSTVLSCQLSNMSDFL